MENRKNLKINTGICDARNVSEELLTAYNEVKINAAAIITNQAAQAMLAKYGAKINCANTVSLPENARFTTVNGPMTITANQAVTEEKLYVLANGPLFIEPGSEAALKNYAGMTVNGPVTCPDSMTSLLHSFTINGPVNTYPDGAIILKKTTVLDRIFYLRAKQDAHYYAAKKVVALSPEIDFGKLAEKNVRFTTRTLLVAESLAEVAVPLFSDRTDIVVLPDGCAYVNDDAELDEVLVKRYGGKLFIGGDLTIGPDSADVLEQVSYLRVSGDLYVCRSLKDRVLAMDMECGELYVTGGTLINGCAQAEVSAAVLENAEDGLSVVNCASVTIAEDVTPELLREKLVSIASCAAVVCANKEQLAIVQALAQDVASFAASGEEDDEDEPEDDDGNVVEINSAFYTL